MFTDEILKKCAKFKFSQSAQKRKKKLLFKKANIIIFFLLFSSSLSFNRLQRLPKGLLDNTGSLETLKLDHNPLVCDCQLKWLADWIGQRDDPPTQTAACSQPFQHQGQRLAHLKPQHFSCTDGKECLA